MLTKKALSDFGRRVVKDARRNLKRSGRLSSGKLSRSITSDVNVDKEGLYSVEIEMEEYGQYQDKGVDGVKVKHGSPYKFRDKMPPSSVFDRWSIRKGIAPRDTKGRFLPRKSINFLIARGVYEKGIKPSLFMTKAFETQFRSLPEEVQKQYAEDLEDMLNEQIKSNK